MKALKRPPQALTPAGHDTDPQPVFVWHSVATATEYQLWISQAGGQLFDQRITAASAGCAEGGKCAFQPDITLLIDKTIHWKVRAFNAAGQESRWSVVRRYTLKGPQAPRTIAPRGWIEIAQPAYQWRAVDDAVNYELEVRSDNETLLTQVVAAATAGCAAGGVCELVSDLSLENDRYRFRVRAESAAGFGKWSGFRSFRVRNVVVDPNQPPVAKDQSLTVDEDGSIEITLNASDPDGDALTYSVVTPPANGSLSGTAPNLTYTPDPNFSGPDGFTFTVSDGLEDSAEAEVSITVNPIPEQPQNLTATAGNAEVQLNWDVVPDADSYAICMAETAIVDAVSCSNGTPFTAQSNSLLIDDSVFSGGLTNGTTYYFVVLAVITSDIDGSQTYSEPSEEVTATPQDAVEPTPTGQLNDTGITLCGDYAFGNSNNHNNEVICTATQDDDGDPVPEGQDADYGRDVTDNDPTNGWAGFDFTKIGVNGEALAAGATEWSCVKDNVTGLVWEVKTDDGGVRDKDHSYTWYQTDNNGGNPGTLNGGSCHVDTGSCDTAGFVAKVNTDSLCGASDWRMPTREELRSIVNYHQFNPAADSNYFPNTQASVYWSSSPFAPSSLDAWGVNFYFGNDGSSNRHGNRYVRLVRSRQ